MTYIVPSATGHVLAFDGEGYVPPTGEAVGFIFGDPGEPPAFEYPIPPSLLSTASHGILLASVLVATDSAESYSLTPAKRSVRRQIQADSSKPFGTRAENQWTKTSPTDDPAEWVRHGWDHAANIDAGLVDAVQSWNKVPTKDDNAPPQSWDMSIRRTDEQVPQPWIRPPFKDVLDIQGHIDSVKYWERPPPVEESTYYNPGSSDFNLRRKPYIVPSAALIDINFLPPDGEVTETNDTPPTRALFSGRDLQGWETNTPTDSRFRHPWDRKPRVGTELVWDYDQEPPLPDKDPADIPEIKESYLYMNASSLKKMPEGIPLEFADLQISLDIDSFSWAMSATILNQASMNQIKPGPSGPVEVEAKVNNKAWRFMIERYTVTSKHPKTAYKVSGSSLTQLLAAPYSAKQSAQITTPTNALQVIQDILENTGFEIDWDVSLADYTIPAGAWGYESKTPIEVIDELVKAAGGVLVPATALSKLYAAQRYREAPPWYWPAIDSSSLDFQIADSTISSLSSEWQPTTEYRGVYVSGITQGVAVDVKKNGSDGLPRAPDVYDALNLTTQQCRGRGISILGQSGAQEIVTIELPLPTSGAPGLVVPGKWGEIQETNDSENNWRALVLSTTVSVSRPGASRAMQTIRLERHHY
ncbi:MAG: hypothetical protein P1U47_05385 [Zhongshania sp.]|uniref:hypothetical protein n=1 Tax=Zhongshania sp. TaxID=1971902 RepID=UPI00260D129F|nr:hypothetical protein [Zhongshania sp.]MDF1691781.1 hypothetical protein [Zhongshania sp.]